jgi:sugar transferase EpsL
MLFKRVFDILGSALLLIVFSPLFIIVGVCIKYSMSGPIFFIQLRPGYKSKPFKMIKFKSMLELKDYDGKMLADDLRLTSIGLFIRKYSIDELPELWNVFKGDMSLVGPRPLLMEYLPLYSKKQARRHDVLPGITGWAQVNGRNSINWGEKFSYDLWYIDNQSFWLDIKILYISIKKIIIKEGIYTKEGRTMAKFKGNK